MRTTHTGTKSGTKRTPRRIRTRAVKAIVGTAVVAAATGFAAIGLASPASAQELDYRISVTCTPQQERFQCGPDQTRSVFTTGSLWLEFTLDQADCSDIYVYFQVDGIDYGAHQVAPGQLSDGYYKKVPFGLHTVGVHASANDGGCNTGSFSSWAGSFQVETSLDALRRGLESGQAQWGDS